MVAIKGHFDGNVFVPDEPVNLPRGHSVVVYPNPAPEPQESRTDELPGDVFDVLDALAGSVEMPPDWAAEHDHYLYGTPKRCEKKEE